MWLIRLAVWLRWAALPLIRIFSGIGCAILFLMMILTGADVALRYIFNSPIMGSMEVTEYMMAILVSFGLAYAAINKGNIRAEFILCRLPQMVQKICNSITSLLGLSLFFTATWVFFQYAIEQYIANVSSTVLHIPMFPFIFLVALASLLLTIVLIAEFFEFLYQGIKK